MENIPVTMIRTDLNNMSLFNVPSGYKIRLFREGEEQIWMEVATSSGLFETMEQARARYDEEFAAYVAELTERCFFMENDQGKPIGTAMAWYQSDFLGECYGRIHWVGMIPEYQGKGLAKPLLSAALHRLAQSHGRAYLTTQTMSYKAIRMYLDFGFAPWPHTPDSEEAWRILRERTKHPSLDPI